MKTIHIVCSSDDGYVSHCGALIASIFENNKKNSVCIHVLTEYLSKQNKSFLLLLGKKYGQNIEIVNIQQGAFDDFPMDEKNTGYINKSTYYRLLIPSLFPKLNKVIYLDCDIIVNCDLLPLWNIDIDMYAIAGVKDVISNQLTGPRRLGYDIKDSYFNAGVGVWNIFYLREHNFDKLTMDFMLANRDNIIFHDQDIINGILHGHFFELSIQWNLMTAFLYGENYNRLSKYKEEMKYPKIIHFADVFKPWFRECYNPYRFEYDKYLKMTPWYNESKTNKLNKRESILFYTKFCIKQLLGYLGMKKYAFFKH